MVWPQARTAPGLTQRGVCVTNADVIRPRRLCVNLNMKKTDQTLLGDGLVLDAASGAAPKALLVLAQSQAALRADARERLDCVEAAFGSLLEQSPEAELSADLSIRRSVSWTTLQAFKMNETRKAWPKAGCQPPSRTR